MVTGVTVSFPRNRYRMAAIGCQHLEAETASTIIDTIQAMKGSGREGGAGGCRRDERV
jgi:hypothetical protein